MLNFYKKNPENIKYNIVKYGDVQDRFKATASAVEKATDSGMTLGGILFTHKTESSLKVEFSGLAS